MFYTLEIQIQPMLRLNAAVFFRYAFASAIQIQPMLRLNVEAKDADLITTVFKYNQC